MLPNLSQFLVHWGVLVLSLWMSSHVFRGIAFEDKSSLLVSALLLGFANALLRPILILLTFPVTIITFGFFILVINALMVLLVSSLVRGFKVSGFWTAFFASIFISACSFATDYFLAGGDAGFQPMGTGTWM